MLPNLKKQSTILKQRFLKIPTPTIHFYHTPTHTPTVEGGVGMFPSKFWSGRGRSIGGCQSICLFRGLPIVYIRRERGLKISKTFCSTYMFFMDGTRIGFPRNSKNPWNCQPYLHTNVQRTQTLQTQLQWHMGVLSLSRKPDTFNLIVYSIKAIQKQ